MKLLEDYFPITLIVLSFLVSIFVVIVSGSRDLTDLENVLLQLMILIFSLIGSFLFGKRSAKQAAQEIIRPHARSAFRRVLSLYDSLSRVAFNIQDWRDRQFDEVVLIEKLNAIVIEQISSADHALDDWQDIIPEEVEEIRKKHSRKGQEKSKENVG